MESERAINRLQITDRVYGEFEVDDSLIIELTHSPTVQRLRHIDQMGVYRYAIPHINTTRYEHSVGVYQILKRFGATREEQIAGLLHDVSHTVFSHVADHLFGDNTEQTYQDRIHEAFILNSEIPSLLEKHGLDPKTTVDHTNLSLLDQPLPNLCADRLDYGLRDSIVCRVLEQNKVSGILENLEIFEGKWVFTNPDVAKFYAQMSIKMAKDWWAPDWGVLQFQFMARALSKGLEKGVLVEDDLFSTDDEVWEKLKESGDSEIEKELRRVCNVHNIRFEITDEPTEFTLLSKYRGTDPLVRISQNFLVPTSVLFPELGQLAKKAKEAIEVPKHVRIIE